jgi:hypothetical protein
MSTVQFPNLNRPGDISGPRHGLRLGFASAMRITLAVALCEIMVSCGSKTELSPATGFPGTNAPAAAEPIKPEFSKLMGKWERPDGGYVLEIKSVDSSGKVEAGYFNPNPINVSRAAALREGGATKVFVELRDENYPGCTYSLTYDPQNDQLFGQYFQASMQRTFDVVFARMK